MSTDYRRKSHGHWCLAVFCLSAREVRFVHRERTWLRILTKFICCQEITTAKKSSKYTLSTGRKFVNGRKTSAFAAKKLSAEIKVRIRACHAKHKQEMLVHQTQTGRLKRNGICPAWSTRRKSRQATITKSTVVCREGKCCSLFCHTRLVLTFCG